MSFRAISQRRSVLSRGFTLLELLVVIAILGILTALILPAVQAAREAARRTACGNNLRQVGIALHHYHDARSSFPPAAIWKRQSGTQYVSGDQRNFTWIALLLPYLEQGAKQGEIDFRLPMLQQRGADGQPLVSMTFPVLQCPSDSGLADDSEVLGWSNFAGAEGFDWWTRGSPMGGVFNLNQATRSANIVDGTSTTIVVGEVTVRGFGPESGDDHEGQFRSGGGVLRLAGNGRYRCALLACNTNNDVHAAWNLPNPEGHIQGFWWRPGAVQPTFIHCYGINNNWQGASSMHPGGAQFLFADGSARFIEETVDYPGENVTGMQRGSGIWGALNTYAGRDVASLP